VFGPIVDRRRRICTPQFKLKHQSRCLGKALGEVAAIPFHGENSHRSPAGTSTGRQQTTGWLI